MAAKLRNFLIGETFTRLTVVGRVWKSGKFHWRCVCACGNECTAPTTALKRGLARSCGCYQREMTTSRNRASSGKRLNFYPVAQGDERAKMRADEHPLYSLWVQMRARCTRKSAPGAHRYLDRGITVCDRWHSSFSAFLEDMGPRPSPEHSIDRIDNNGPYTPENCRWATPVQQAYNRENTILIDGKSIMEWSTICGLRVKTISCRYHRGVRGPELFAPIAQRAGLPLNLIDIEAGR